MDKKMVDKIITLLKKTTSKRNKNVDEELSFPLCMEVKDRCTLLNVLTMLKSNGNYKNTKKPTKGKKINKSVIAF